MNLAKSNERPSATPPREKGSRFRPELSRPHLKCNRDQRLLNTKNGHLDSLEMGLKWGESEGLGESVGPPLTITHRLRLLPVEGL